MALIIMLMILVQDVTNVYKISYNQTTFSEEGSWIGFFFLCFGTSYIS